MLAAHLYRGCRDALVYCCLSELFPTLSSSDCRPASPVGGDSGADCDGPEDDAAVQVATRSESGYTSIDLRAMGMAFAAVYRSDGWSDLPAVKAPVVATSARKAASALTGTARKLPHRASQDQERPDLRHGVSSVDGVSAGSSLGDRAPGVLVRQDSANSVSHSRERNDTHGGGGNSSGGSSSGALNGEHAASLLRSHTGSGGGSLKRRRHGNLDEGQDDDDQVDFGALLGGCSS